MFFFFVCGEHTFRKPVPGYEGIVAQCHNCGNMACHVIKTHPWFTFCWIPVLPLSLKGYEDVTCNICHFAQPLKRRPDVQAMANGGGGGGHLPPPPGAVNGWQGHQPPPQPPPQRYA